MRNITGYDDFVFEGTPNVDGFKELLPYWDAAEEVEKKGKTKKLSRETPDEFTFHHVNDDCDVTVFLDDKSKCVSMTQDYRNDKSQVGPDTDDIVGEFAREPSAYVFLESFEAAEKTNPIGTTSGRISPKF